MQAFRSLSLLTWFSCLSCASAVHAQEWTRFRGPNGSGVGRNTTMPVKWSERDFNWRVKLAGAGHSSPVLWGGRIFLTSGVEQTGARIAQGLDAESGETLWSREYASAADRKHKLNSFASSTPVVDDRRVYLCYTAGGSLYVLALDHQGKRRWQTKLGAFQSGHGYGVSPVLYDEMVIVANEHSGESSLAALDCATGTVRWRTPRETRVTYSTPCLYRPKNGTGELIFTNWKHGITAVDPRSGKTNWEISVFDQNHTETSIGSPIVAGDLVFGTCGWLGYATQTVAVRPGSAGPGKANEVFRIDRGAPLTTTPLVTDGLLFLWGDDGIVTCADALTGKVHWRKRVGGKYFGSPVAVGKAVYCMSTDGEAVVLAAASEYRLIARNSVLEGSHSTPAIAGGRMYLRTFSHLISIGRK